MCIRDRVVAVDAATSTDSDGTIASYSWDFGDGSPVETGITATHTYACLLYTSDAADERSSVDLGGRRIIKKKKK